ncbi:hypothetical protein ACFLTE_10280 [Bacteroidota bacterium]
MRKQIHLFTIGILTVFFLCTMSCLDFNNECKDINCNNGDCIEGKCHCDEGYTGDYCDTRIIESLFGDYDHTRLCDSFSTPEIRPIRIEDYDNAHDIVNIVALWGDPGSVAEATFQNNFTEIKIPRQDFSFDWQIEGEGIIKDDNNTIEIEFEIYDKHDGLKIDECQVTMNKQ